MAKKKRSKSRTRAKCAVPPPPRQELSPEPRPHFHYEVYPERAGDYAAAAAILEEVLAQREQDAGLREELVHCLRRAGNEDAALEHQLQLARLHRSSGMIGKALETARQVVKARPDDGEILGFLTANHRESGEIREACEFYWSIVQELEKV